MLCICRHNPAGFKPLSLAVPQHLGALVLFALGLARCCTWLLLCNVLLGLNKALVDLAELFEYRQLSDVSAGCPVPSVVDGLISLHQTNECLQVFRDGRALSGERAQD